MVPPWVYLFSAKHASGYLVAGALSLDRTETQAKMAFLVSACFL